MTTPTDIANHALRRIGLSTIASIDSSTNPTAVTAKASYAHARNLILAAHPWNFAVTRYTPARNATTDDNHYTYSHNTPSNLLKLTSIEKGTSAHLTLDDYTRRGATIYSNSKSITIRYIPDDVSPSLFPPNFTEALITRLAAELAVTLKQSPAEQQQHLSLYETVHLPKAKLEDYHDGADHTVPGYARSIARSPTVNARYNRTGRS